MNTREVIQKLEPSAHYWMMWASEKKTREDEKTQQATLVKAKWGAFDISFGVLRFPRWLQCFFPQVLFVIIILVITSRCNRRDYRACHGQPGRTMDNMMWVFAGCWQRHNPILVPIRANTCALPIYCHYNMSERSERMAYLWVLEDERTYFVTQVTAGIPSNV